jgi:hypothetical protein
MDERGYYILNKYIITAAASPEKIEINILYKYIYTVLRVVMRIIHKIISISIGCRSSCLSIISMCVYTSGSS